MNSINKQRIKKELEIFENQPPPGISCSPCEDSLNTLSAQIVGPNQTPFEKGVFNLQIQLSKRYPFDPPQVRFVTPIYHPNIDTSGRICMDTLKLPPKGSWRPCLNISTLLMMIRVLMSEPGAEDPLMTDIWQEYKYNYATYCTKARELTKKHACAQTVSIEKSKPGNSDSPDTTAQRKEENVNDASRKRSLERSSDKTGSKKSK